MIGAAEENENDIEEFLNDTVAVDNDTLQVYVYIEDSDGADVDVSIYGIDSDGDEFEEHTGVLNAPEGDLDTVEIDADPETYDSYRVILEGETEPDAMEIGVISRLEGGAGIGGISWGTEIFGLQAWIIALGALLVVGYVYTSGNGDNGRH